MTHQGNRIDEVRQQIGITKAELARRIGTSNQNLHDIFSREEIRSIDYLKKFSEALNHDFLTEFYHSDIEQSNLASTQEQLEEELFEKLKMQGRVEQLEEMLKKGIAKEIGEEIINHLNKKISVLANQLDSISQRQKDLDKELKSLFQAQKTA